MQAPQTDVIANELNLRLFFFTLAAMAFFEALKMERPRSYVAWALCILAAAAGTLTFFPTLWPAGLAAVQWFGAVAASPFTWATLFLLAYLMWREKYRGPRASGQQLPELDHTEADRLSDKIEALTVAATDSEASLRQRVEALESEVEGVKDGKDTLREGVQAFMGAAFDLATKLTDRLSTRIDVLQELVDETAKKTELEAIQRSCEKFQEKVDKDEKLLRSRFAALYARERMKALALELEQDAELLSQRVMKGEAFDEAAWDSWQSVHHHWEAKLKEWYDTARWYGPDAKARIMTVKDEEYDGIRVEEDLFPRPSADPIRKFKRHYIIHRHWREIRDEFDAGVYQVAFIGLTEGEMHGGKYHQ